MGKKSTIDSLDPAVKSSIDALLKDGRLTLDQVLQQIRSAYPAAAVPSRSSLGRYSQRFDQVAKKLRESRSVAEVWAEKLGSEPQGDVGKVVLELLRTLAFQTSLELSEENGGLDGQTLSHLALAMQRIETAGNLGVKREQAVRDAALQEAARQIEEAAKTKKVSGLSRESAEQIRRMILGGGS